MLAPWISLEREWPGTNQINFIPSLLYNLTIPLSFFMASLLSSVHHTKALTGQYNPGTSSDCICMRTAQFQIKSRHRRLEFVPVLLTLSVLNYLTEGGLFAIISSLAPKFAVLRMHAGLPRTIGV